MKVGLTVDSEGEDIDYNKVDTALKSVGISIKDAQGQFRDFDDVIFELSAKWNSLDKNTQRYIATIMAGNRQQSRFIALVDNWERLDEVANAAQDSEDAGLLQYAKTLDSLDTKLNNLKTSFQSFYMSIFNGEFFKGAVDLANNLVQSFSRLGPILGGINLLQLINQIKLVGQLLINSFSGAIQKIQKSRNEWQKEFTNGWESVGERIANIIAAAIRNGAKEGANDAKNEAQNAAQQKQIQPLSPTSDEYKKDKNIWTRARKQLNFSPLLASGIFAGNNRLMEGALQQLSVTGAQDIYELKNSYEAAAKKILDAGDTFGESAQNWAKKVVEAGENFSDLTEKSAQEEYQKELAAADIEAQKEIAAAEKEKALKTKVQAGQAAFSIGTALSAAGMMINQSTMKGYHTSTGLQAAGSAATAAGQWLTGDKVGAVITAITGLVTTIQRIAQSAEVALENAQKNSEEKNVKRAETKNEYTTLQSLLKQYEEAEKNKNVDQESYQAWLDINNQLVEAYPELLEYIDAEGNAIADVTSKSKTLSYYMNKAAEASRDYYNAKITELELQLANNKGQTYTYHYQKHYGQDKNVMSSSFQEAAPYLASIGVTGEKYTDAGGVLVELFTDGDTQQHNYRINIEDLVRSLEVQNINLTKLLSEYNSADLTQRSTEKFGLIRDLIHFGVIKESEQQPGYYTYQDTFKEYQDAYHRQNELIGYKKGAATQNLSLLLSNTSIDDLIDGIEGYEELFYSYAMSLENITNDVLRNLSSSSPEWQTLIDGYTKLYNGFSLADQEIISALFNNLGNYSLNELQSQLTNKLNLSEGNELFDAFTKQWYEKNYSQLARWIENYQGATRQQQIDTTNTAFSNGLDIHNWIKQKAINENDVTKYNLDNIDNLYKEYYQELQGALNQDDPFYKFIKYNSDAAIEGYLTYLSNENKFINLQAHGADVASQRKEKINKIIQESNDATTELGKLLSSNEEAKLSFWQTLFTDTGTYEWAENMEKWGSDYKISGFENFSNLAYENYNTRLNQSIKAAIAVNEKVNELFGKQEKGFSWDESQALLKEYQKASDESNASWANLFEVNEEGAIVLQDIGNVLNTFYQSEINTLQRHSDRNRVIKDLIKDNWTNDIQADLEVALKGNIKDDSYARGMANALSKLLKLELEPDELYNLTIGIQSGAINSYNSLLDFYTKLGYQIDAANEAAQKAWAATLGSDAIKKRTEKFTERTQAKNLLGGGSYEDLASLWKNAAINQGKNYQTDAEWNDYYAQQEQALVGGFINDYGELIITNAKEFTTYLLTAGIISVDSFEAVYTDAKRMQAETQEELVSATQEGITNIQDSFQTTGKVAITDFTSLFDKLFQGGIIDQDTYNNLIQASIAASEDLSKGITNSYEALMSWILSIVQDSLKVDSTLLQAQQADSRRAASSSHGNIISDAAKGQAKNTDWYNLTKATGINQKEYYNKAIEGANGLQADAETLLQVASELVKSGEMLASEAASSLAEAFQGSRALGTYRDIENEIEKLTSKSEGLTEVEKERLAVLQEIAAIYSQSPDDARFDFMNFDIHDGQIDNWDTFTKNISTGMNLITSAFTKGSKTSVREFEKLLHFIAPEGDMAQKIKGTEVTFQQFADALKAGMDITGQVDLSGVAKKLGVGMDDVVGAFDDGIDDIARSQLAYWRNYLAYLIKMRDLEKTGGEVNLEGIGVKIAPPELQPGGGYRFNRQTYATEAEAWAAYRNYVLNKFMESRTKEQQETVTTGAEEQGIAIKQGENGWTIDEEGSTLKGEELQQAYIDFIQQYVTDYVDKYDTNDLPPATISALNASFNVESTTITPAGELPTPTDSEIAPKNFINTTMGKMGWNTSDGGLSYTCEKNGAILTAVVDPSTGSVVSISGYDKVTAESLSAGEIAGIFVSNGISCKFTANSLTFDDYKLTTNYEVTASGSIGVNNNGITGPAPLTDEELAAKLGPGWNKDQTASTEGKLVYKHPSGIILTYDTTTKKIEAKLPEGVEPARFADLKKVLEAAGYTQVSGAIFSPKDGYLTFTIEAKSQDIEVPVPGVKNLEDGWQKGLTNLNNWTWDDIGMFINGEVLSFKYNTKTEDLEVTTPGGLNVDNSRKVSEWIKSQGYEIVNGTSFQDQDGYVYSFALKTKTEDLKLNNPTGIDETGLNVDQIFTSNNWVKDEEAGSNTYSKALDGYIVKWNVTAGTIDVVGADGITPVDDATKEAIIKKALGDNYDSTNKIATLADGITAKVTVSKVDPTYTGGTASISGLKFDGGTVEVTFKPITDAVTTAIDGIDGKTITVNVDFKPRTPGSTPTNPELPTVDAVSQAAPTPSESALDVALKDYEEYGNNNATSRTAALKEVASALEEVAAAGGSLEEDDAEKIKEIISSVNELDANNGNATIISGIASSFVTLGGVQTTQIATLSSFLAILQSSELLTTLPALSQFFTIISSTDLTELNFDEIVVQLSKLNDLDVDVDSILSIASAISTLGAAWATLPTSDTDVTVKANDNATAVIRRIQGALDALKDKVVKIDVENDEKPLTIKVEFVPKEGMWTGNVNDLGPAFAEGSVGKLLAGASFANKTLVGELGPELAVYNGRYHLLGQNGAEFVNLPSDAIVFNHKQTEGIVKGQTRIRGMALAEGNVSGPAAASGLDGAIAAVQDIIAMWQGILNASAQQLANGGSGGGGGGGTAQAPTAELQEWYNLSREIARIEQEINTILAERKNITDGREYLRSLREQQSYLNTQLDTQKQLYEYQKKQLERQQDEINKDKVWSKFLTVDADGRLRYKNGNETGDGKGALDVLAALNKKNLNDQYKTILGYGYKAYDNTGKDITKDLSKEELVQHFFDTLQAQIDAYDSLYDTVHAAEQAMAELEASIAEIDAEILQNTMDLEQAIYDIIVENAEKAIEKLEEYTEKLGEANEAYIDGLKESLDAEKEQYEKEKSDEELSQLQRRLNLLRRTGGSATEIADLEEQLNDALKEQYFSEQEKLIDELEKTSEQQIEKLEQQITIQQETLEFQKEAGLIWNQVAEIMSGSQEEIQGWLTSNGVSLGDSANQINQTLQEWSMMTGMYVEDRDKWRPAYEQAQKDTEGKWNAGIDNKGNVDENSIWKNSAQKNQALYAQLFNSLDSTKQNSVQTSYYRAYANAIANGKTKEEAQQEAQAAAEEMLMTLTGGKLTYSSGNEKAYSYRYDIYNKDGTVKQEDLRKRGKEYTDKNGNTRYKSTTQQELEAAVKANMKKNFPKDKNDIEKAIATKGKGDNNSTKKQKETYEKWWKAYRKSITNARKGYVGINGFSQGGLVDYTGPAVVHGTPSKPEAFLNAKQTAMISDAVRAAGEGNVLDGIRATLASLDSSIRSLVTNNITTQSSNITVAPGAVVLNVAKLNDSYDIEELSNDIMNRMVNIASKATNRGVNRR